MIVIMLAMIKDANLKQPSHIVRFGGTRLGSSGLMDKVYYKEFYFDLLFPMWFKKFILRLVKPVVTQV